VRVTSRFFWRGNDLGLDLLNTEAVDGHGSPLDLMPDVEALLDWAEEAGILSGADAEACRNLPRHPGRSLFEWVRRLRSGMRALVDPAGQAAPGDEERLAGVVAEVPVTLTLPPVADPGGTPVAASGPADRLRLALALAAIETIGLDRSRIRRCEGAGCVLLYYDTSRNGSRRWCDMGACGNRAKAAAHYRRSRAVER